MHASVEFLLEHRPPGLHLVLASRADPPLRAGPAAGPRPAGRAARRRPAVHRRGGGGAAAPGGAARAGLPDDGRGGAGGPHRGLGGRPAAGRAVAARAGRRGRLRGGVHRQPPLRPGLPGRGGARAAERSRSAHVPAGDLGAGPAVGGPLCDAVTGRAGSQALLEQVERAGLFLVPLDEVRGWWRYHHLFADLLRARLQAGAARPGGRAAPQRGGLVRASTGWPMTRSGTRWPPGELTWAARLIEQHFDAVLLPARRGSDAPALAGGAARRAGPVPAAAAAGPGPMAAPAATSGGMAARSAGRGRAAAVSRGADR